MDSSGNQGNPNCIMQLRRAVGEGSDSYNDRSAAYARFGEYISPTIVDAEVDKATVQDTN